MLVNFHISIQGHLNYQSRIHL